MYTLERGKSCRFKLADVICPEQESVVLQLTADLEVSGEILFMSDQGRRPDRFAIIEVEGITSPVIVPVECIKSNVGKEEKLPFDATCLTPRY
ncbi:MAG: hypothetical protein JSV03_00545 [Planctomycetota bacterium]|nr:MAG: hypothetical protein JSV03_00545 [Planctomycetota bacterium]